MIHGVVASQLLNLPVPTVQATPVTLTYRNSVYTGFTVSATGGVGPYTFALVGTWPAGLSINSSTGVVTGTATVAGTYNGLSVSVTDNIANTANMTSFSMVVGLAVSISGTPVTTGIEGGAYAGFTVTSAGGSGGRVYSKIGTWPAGIALNTSTGVVSGTPTTQGTYASLSVRVTDSGGRTADLSTFTITVASSLAINGTPVTTAVTNSVYTGFTATASGGVAPYTYSITGTWPAGLTINSATGAVSGTPTLAGSYTGLSVRVTDGNADTADLPTFSVTVAAAPEFSFVAAPVSGDNVKTFTGVALGAADADRYILCMLNTSSNGGPQVTTGVSIAGIAATRIANALSGAQFANCEAWIAAVPTGTTGTVIVTSSQTRVQVTLYRMKGFNMTPTSIVASTLFDPATQAAHDVVITCPVNGVALIGGAVDANTTFTITGTGVTTDHSDGVGGTFYGVTARSTTAGVVTFAVSSRATLQSVDQAIAFGP